VKGMRRPKRKSAEITGGQRRKFLRRGKLAIEPESNLIMFPGVFLKPSDPNLHSSPRIHPDTGIPFTGRDLVIHPWKPDSMRHDYMTLKDGVLHGLKECFIRKRSGHETPYTRGRYRHGIPVGVHHHYYENGICSVRKKYGNPCNNRSRVLKLDAWMPCGKKCPNSHIDESGDGVHYVYSDFYRKLREIHFYANHELRSLLILDKNGKLKDVLSNLHAGNLYEWSLAG